MEPDRIASIDKYLRITIFIVFILISLGSSIAPATQSIFGYPHGEPFYSFYSGICHQYPTRCLWILNHPFALCARCFSGYLGIALASILIKSKSKYYIRLILGIILLGLVSIDPIIQLNTDYESTNIVRVITGLLGGVSIFLITYPIKYRRLK